ncbi:MAG: exosortase C-terminal domain/associated protein EpsI [Gemmatimonadaceae bacterium]
MNQKFIPFLPAAVLLVGVAFISGVREQYVTKPVLPMDSLPWVYEGVTGKDVAVPEDQQKIAGMDEFMYREFRIDSANVFSTYVGYYNRQVQGKSIHSPKNCLPGAGWDIMENAPVALNEPDASAPIVNRVVLANKGARALVYYWYQGRGRIASNEYRVKWDLLRDAALYGRTEEALVRIIVFVPPAPTGKDVKIDAALVKADSLARRVAVPLSQSVYKVLPPFKAS